MNNKCVKLYVIAYFSIVLEKLAKFFRWILFLAHPVYRNCN